MVRPRLAFLVLLVIVIATSAVGCPCLRGAVNDSPSIRWFLFSNFGASRICPEAQKRGVPLKLPALGQSSLGRFFPDQCQVTVNDAQHTISLRVAGHGYAMLPVTRRLGFSAAVQVEFAPDFRLEDDAIYVWGRFQRVLSGPELRIVGVENPVVNLATHTPVGDVATVLGQVIVASELARGFTVVRTDDGDDFTLGILQPPDKPKRQFSVDSGHVLLASDLTEVHASSRDYTGPFEVSGSDKALRLKTRITGGPVVFGVVDAMVGDAWLRQYETGQRLVGPPGAVLYAGTLQPGEAVQKFPLAPGRYFVVFENQAPPPSAPLGVPLPFTETIAYVTYSAELGPR